jgi:hypothetical protein
MHILALLAGNVVSTMWLNKNTVDTDPATGSQPGVPMVYGYDARKVGMGLGIAGALGLVGGPLGMLLVGMGLASYNSQDAAARWTDAWAQFMAGQATMDEPTKGKLAGALKSLTGGALDFLSNGKNADVAGDDLVGLDNYAPSLPGIC